MTMTPEELRAMAVDLEGETIFIDQDGDACLAPSGRDMNLVALPGRDDDGSLLRPDAWAAMVNRFNTFPAIALALADALDLLAKRDAELARVTRERDEWRDVVSWLDNGEKTIFDWCTGGGHADGEFSRIGLRREFAGKTLYRTYTADGPWGLPAITPEPEGETL